MKKFIKSILPVALMLAGAATAVAEDSFEFTYGDLNDQTTNLGYGNNTPGNLPVYYNMCIKIDNPDFVGMRVTGIKIDYPVTFDGSSYMAWVANELGGTRSEMYADSCEVTYNADDWASYGTFHGNGVVIPEGGIYVGYELGITQYDANDDQYSRALYPLALYAPKHVKNSCLMWLSSGQPAAFGEYDDWTDYNWDGIGSDGLGYGCINIVAYIAGQGKEYAVCLNKLTPVKADVVKGEPIQLVANVTNLGQTAATTLGYEYTLNGQTGEGTINLDEDFVGNPAVKKDFTLDLPSVSEPGEYPITVNIKTINGNANQSVKPSASTSVVVPLFRAEKKVIMEEATATWCGWCTRGLFAMDSLKKLYPNDFIATAWHASDAMMVCSAGNYFNFGGGYPGCAIDRTINGADPYYGDGNDNFGVKANVESQLASLAYGNLGVKSTFNGDKSQLTVDASVEFGAVKEGAWKLGYILLQNGIQVDGNQDFAQNNYYASYKGQYDGAPILEELTNMPNPIPNFKYDDIVINATGANGIENSLPSPLEYGKVYNHTYTLNCANIYSISKLNDGSFEYPQDDEEYNLAKNPEEMEIVVILINPEGQIVNALKAAAGTSVDLPVGITGVEADSNAPAIYFNLQGQRVNNPANGNLYIRVQGQNATKVIL